MDGAANIAKKALVSVPEPLEQLEARINGPGRTKLLLEDKLVNIINTAAAGIVLLINRFIDE